MVTATPEALSDGPVSGEPVPISADESGTAPGDRRFRPDIQGLRAIAVILVVLYHASLPGLGGGYVGVDVFFVISGFVITGVLLREPTGNWRRAIGNFYARRCRRIIPAATLVILVTVFAAYVVLGEVGGNATATDARWTAVFLANFHFASVGNNYLTAHRAPSPLLNFWSLGVEEQFYVVYPALFLVVFALRARLGARVRLLIGLGVVIVASFVLSVAQTAADPTTAYYSPFTRAWELALGALVAVGTPWLLGLPRAVGAVASWIGCGAIVVSAIAYGATTAYPGWAVALPVVGAALVIAGGTPAPQRGAESVLGTRPFQWFGKTSYSLYLWHWPILVLAAESAGQRLLPFHDNLWWLLVAVAAAAITFRLLEDPVRHAKFGGRRLAPIVMGLGLVVVVLVASTAQLSAHSGTAGLAGTNQATKVSSLSAKDEKILEKVVATPSTLAANVADAPRIRTLPAGLTPTPASAVDDFGAPPAPCFIGSGQSTLPPGCIFFGDLHATRTVAIWGDSHAAQWFQALALAARLGHWRLAYLGKGDCPANDLAFPNPKSFAPVGPFVQCEKFHRFAVDQIRAIKPQLLVITQVPGPSPDHHYYTPAQWADSLERTIRATGVPPGQVAILGDTPIMPLDPPQCLGQHPDAVQKCSAPLTSFVISYNRAEQEAASTVGASYVNTIPWFCSSTCTSIIGNHEVYFDYYHITATYAYYVAGVLSDALHLGARIP